jgi:hypothetical protein
VLVGKVSVWVVKAEAEAGKVKVSSRKTKPFICIPSTRTPVVFTWTAVSTHEPMLPSKTVLATKLWPKLRGEWHWPSEPARTRVPANLYSLIASLRLLFIFETKHEKVTYEGQHPANEVYSLIELMVAVAYPPGHPNGPRLISVVTPSPSNYQSKICTYIGSFVSGSSHYVDSTKDSLRFQDIAHSDL